MLTVDMVEATRRKGTLYVRPVDGKRLPRALELAQAFVRIAQASVGRSREEFEEACSEVQVSAADRKLARGLRKLIEDRAEFDAISAAEPMDLRRSVFAEAHVVRRGLEVGCAFERSKVLEQVSQKHGLNAAALEQGLFADLRGAHILSKFDPLSAEALIALYTQAQAQAVLLKALHVEVEVECRHAAAYRALFNRIKFLMLVVTIEALPADRYRLKIDGPYSLFDATTKYGVKLSQLLPLLEGTSRYQLEAHLRWGPNREDVKFYHQGGLLGDTDLAPADDQAGSDPVPENIVRLVQSFEALGSDWRISMHPEILPLPGFGLIVPDLFFENIHTGMRVFLEVLGFWSRDAVWRRVELVEAGLPQRILFAVSSRLRVSQAVLPDTSASALYVYKGSMSAKAILEYLARFLSTDS